MPARVLTSVGTPLVPVTAVHGTRVSTIRLKVESANRFGSIKARTAVALVDDMTTRGGLRPGMRIVESTSGNLGVALAGIAGERGYRFTAVVDPRTSPELLRRMHELGAELELVTEPDGAGGYLGSRLRRVAELATAADSVWPNQYANPANPRAHE